MIRTISTAVFALALAMGGSATLLGGTALASTGAAPAQAIHTAPTGSTPGCVYTIYFMGVPWSFPCPANSSNGGTATNNCNANCSASAVGTKGSSH